MDLGSWLMLLKMIFGVIGNIAIEKARAKKIYFSNPYVQTDANVLVRRDPPFSTMNQLIMRVFQLQPMGVVPLICG